MRKTVIRIAATGLVAGTLATPRAAAAQDREPIRIRNKVLFFDLDPNTPRTWKRDRIGEQWKPVPSYPDDVSTFEVVTILPKSGCATFTAREVVVKVVFGQSTRDFRLYVRRNFDLTSGGFWDKEPKLDADVPLDNTTNGAKRLKFREPRDDVYISHVFADGTERCAFAATEKVVELEATPMR